MPKLSIIIVNYNTSDLLRRCLSSVYDSTKELDFEIIVLDNNSSDDSVNMVRDEFKGVILLSNRENKGFASASNQGIKLSKGEYVLLLNPDCEVYPRAVEKMIHFLEENPKIGIIGPRLLNANKTTQTSFGYSTTLALEVMKRLHIGRGYLPKKFKKSSLDLPTLSSPSEVHWISGACFLIRKRVISEVGFLDEDFFFAGEDVDWCLRARQKNWKVYYHPGSEVLHYGGESVKSNISKTIAARYKTTFVLFSKRWDKRKMFILRCSVVLGLVLRIAYCFLLAPIYLWRNDKESIRVIPVYLKIIRLYINPNLKKEDFNKIII